MASIGTDLWHHILKHPMDRGHMAVNKAGRHTLTAEAYTGCNKMQVRTLGR